MREKGPKKVAPLAEPLTAREQGILSLVGQGRTNRQIAEELVLAHSTVRWYLRQIYAKLGVKGRDEAVSRARALGLAAAAEAPAAASNLPAVATPFVGRQVELQGLDGMLLDPRVRLLTIVGPGGMGKTRLALALAARQIGRRVPGSDRLLFPDGVRYASLAPIATAGQLIPAVAEALRLNLQPPGGLERSPEGQVRDFLHRKRLLLVLDNFEHLLDAAPLLARMTVGAPDLKILVTSRQRLQLQGEQLFWIQGLAFPEEGHPPAVARRNPAVQLFAQAAQRVQPAFALGDDTLAAVTRTCRLLEGTPLAIELAASWAGVLSPAAIAEEVGQGLAILTNDLQDVPARHRSMQATINQSWKRLGAAEKDLFRQLAVFRGGFTLDAARAVAGATPQALRKLVERSWLARGDGDRFHIHELLRRFAAGQLAGSPELEEAVGRRHAHYYCAFLRQRERDLQGPGQQAALREIEGDLENIRAAWHWAARQRDSELLEQALFSLGHFCDWRIRWTEGEALFGVAAEELAPARAASKLRVRARILAWLSDFIRMQGQSDAIEQLQEESLAILNSPPLSDHETGQEEARVMFLMGQRILDTDAATRRLEKSLTLYQEHGNRWMTARVLRELGKINIHAAEYERAERLLQESLIRYRSLGDERGIGFTLMTLAYNALPQGQFAEAGRLAREYLAIRRALGDPISLALGLENAGRALIWSGEYAEGVAMLEESLPAHRDRGGHPNIAVIQSWLGYAHCHLGKYRRAVGHIEKGLALFREVDMQSSIALWFLGQTLVALEAYEEAQSALQTSATLFRESGEPNELGLVLGTIGHVYYRLGKIPEALHCVRQGLRIGLDVRAFMPFYATLPVISLLYAARGDVVRAAELYALLERYQPVANSRWFVDVAGRELAAAGAELSPEVVAAARERGRARDLWQTGAELLEELSVAD